MSIFGCDISHYQGRTFDVRGQGFVFVKFTEGVGVRDPTDLVAARAQWVNCKTAGVLRGSYHFARPHNTAAAEAAYYISFARSVGQTIEPIALDYEVDPYSRTWAQSWLQLVKAAFPSAPVGVYSSKYGFASLGGPLGEFIWYAHPQQPDAPVPAWVDILQYTDKPYDRNIIRGHNPFLPSIPTLPISEEPFTMDQVTQIVKLLTEQNALLTALRTEEAARYKVDAERYAVFMRRFGAIDAALAGAAPAAK